MLLLPFETNVPFGTMLKQNKIARLLPVAGCHSDEERVGRTYQR